jgi:hypothetical protein
LTPNCRTQFNASFTEEKYQKMLQEIEAEFPGALDFRVAESPVFIDREFKTKILVAFNDIIDQILKPDFIAKTERAIPANRRVGNESPRPSCLAVDFAVTLDQHGKYEPQLIELQGFPSLFAYQSYLAGKYKKHFDVDRNFSAFFNRINAMGYQEEMRKFLLADIPAENTILLEIEPDKQKTRLDFELTKQFWGIEPVCITRLRNEGGHLYYTKGEEKVKVLRVYNRLIPDDLDRNYPNLKVEVDLNKATDVQWVSHPNWFYRVSKYSLPLFKSRYIPESHYLSDFVPEDLENYVLKPLFSFAGAGVNLHPTKEDIQRIENPQDYLLQRKVSYAPCIEDVRGEKIKCELRLLAIWPDGASRPRLVTNLTRLSRGEMIGVDFNKNFDWVGGSVGFYETN